MVVLSACSFASQVVLSTATTHRIFFSNFHLVVWLLQDGFCLVADTTNHAIRCLGASPDWSYPEDAISVASRNARLSTPPGSPTVAASDLPAASSPARTKIKAAREAHIKAGGDPFMFDCIIDAAKRCVLAPILDPWV